MRVRDDNFEMNGMKSGRTLKDFLFWKLLPAGNLAEGPGIVWLVAVMLRHRFGRRLAEYRIKRQERNT